MWVTRHFVLESSKTKLFVSIIYFKMHQGEVRQLFFSHRLVRCNHSSIASRFWSKFIVKLSSRFDAKYGEKSWERERKRKRNQRFVFIVQLEFVRMKVHLSIYSLILLVHLFLESFLPRLIDIRCLFLPCFVDVSMERSITMLKEQYESIWKDLLFLGRHIDLRHSMNVLISHENRVFWRKLMHRWFHAKSNE